MRLSKKYEFNDIYKTIWTNLEQYLTLENVVSILDFLMKNQNAIATEKCYKFLDRNALGFTISKNFVKLSESALLCLFKRDTFELDEMRIFTAASKWYEQNPMSNKEQIKKAIRFPLMNINDLLSLKPAPLTPNHDQIIEIVKMKTLPSTLTVKKRQLENELINQSKKLLLEAIGANIVHGKSSKMCNFNVWHETIFSDKNQTIIIEFDTVRLINHIGFKIDQRYGFGYVIEVSLEGKEWKQIIDYSKYHCQHEQRLYFETEEVKLIKITKASPIVDFFAQLADSIPPRVDGIIIATKGMIEKAYMNHKYTLMSDGFEAGYAHNKSSYTNSVKFNQPYLISSFSFNCVGKFRSEIKINNQTFIKKKDEFLHGHCVFTFTQTIIERIQFESLDYDIIQWPIKVTNFSVPAQELPN